MKSAMRAALTLFLTLASAAVAQFGPVVPFVIAETGQGFPTLDAAVSTILNGQSGTILIAPGTYRECTVQASGRIAFKVREPGMVVFDGVACEEKAAFVLRGRGRASTASPSATSVCPTATGRGSVTRPAT